MKNAPEHMAPNSRSLKNQKLGREKQEIYLNDSQSWTKDLSDGSKPAAALGSDEVTAECLLP